MKRTKKILTVPAQHVIAQAVEPLRVAAVAQATEQATAFLADLKAQVDAQPLINTLAPYPKYVDKYRAPTAEYAEYSRAYDFRTLVDSVTVAVEDEADEHTYRAYDPQTAQVAWDAEGAARYMQKVVAKAEHNFVVYALKLIGKVEKDGNVATAASLSGHNDLWSESTLSVTLASGATQRWYTKMIWNRSVLGNIFNQFPTRLLK